MLFVKVHRSYVLLIFAIGLIIGIILGVFFTPWIFNSIIWLVLSCILLLINFFIPQRVFLCCALFAGVVLGGFRTGNVLGDYKYIAQFIGQTISVSGVVIEDPESGGGSTTLRLSNLEFGEDERGKPIKGSLYIKFYGTKKIERSYRISLKGSLSEGFGAFAGSMYNPEIVDFSKPDPPDLALIFRDWFADLAKKHISEPEVDLSLGYLLGQRRSLPANLLETMKAVGLTHIIVASGYNLSVLVRLMRKLFGKISRFAALFFGILLILCFISITGFTPSMARAGIVSVLSLLAWFFGRKFHPAKLLTIVASMTLLINPNYIQDLGWLLSFASFFGVMLIGPLITAYFYGDKKPNAVAQVVIETVAAQICCLPMLIYFFGSFSLVSIVANALILPTIPFVMFLTFSTGVLSFLPPLASLVGWGASKLLWLHIEIVKFFGNLTWANIVVPTENPLVLLFYPVIIVAAIYMWKRTKIRFIQANVLE